MQIVPQTVTFMLLYCTHPALKMCHMLQVVPLILLK